MTTDEIHIEGLELPVHIGVPDAERVLPQVLRAWVIIGVKPRLESMQDDVSHTIDYEAVANALRALAAERPRRLIETLAAEMAALVLERFGAVSVEITLRKRILPGTDAVAVRLKRSR